MLNAIVIDKNENSAKLIGSYLDNIEGVRLCAQFAYFNDLNYNLDEINLIIFDITFNQSDSIIKKIREIKTNFPQIQFIATSYEINSELVSKILKEDVKEFLLKPLIPNILEKAINKLQNTTSGVEISKANIISVFSNKGGVGKTSLAVNLAYEIASNINDKVCLLDLSFSSGDISTFLNLQFKNSIDMVLNSLKNQDEKTILNLTSNYANSNLYVLSFLDDFNYNTKLDPSALTTLIGALKGSFKYIIIDTANTLDESTISVLNSSDLILLLGLMNLASIRNCQKCYEMFENLEYNKNKIKLIINRYIENSEISLEDTQKTIGADVFYKIPNNYLTLIDAINLGRCVIETNPQSNIAKAYKNLAKEITNIDFINLGESNKKANYNHGIFNLLRRMGE